jgi:hypothetical protein
MQTSTTTRSLSKKPCLDGVDEANDLSRIASGRPRLQVDPAIPPALHSKLLKFLISTLINRLNTHEIRVARCEFEVKISGLGKMYASGRCRNLYSE